MSTKNEKLFADFEPTSTQEWMDKVTTDLKGVPFEKKLVWRTKEGFNVNPLYRREDIKDMETAKTLPGEFPYIRGTKVDNHWFTRQEVKVEDISVTNAKLVDLTERGVDSFGLHFEKEDVSEENVRELIKGLDLSKIELNFIACRSVIVKLAQAVVKVYQESGADLNTCQGSIEFDPFKKQLLKGLPTDDWKSIAGDLLKAVAPLPKFTCLNVKSVNLANAGAYSYQELGYALAEGAELLNTLSEEGKVAEVADRIRFDMGISSVYFMEIAKFRAARWLWALMTKAHGVDEESSAAKLTIHAETSRWNKTLYDAYVNLLRTTTESMSASLAGVHSLTTLPFDKVFKEPDAFSERIARNQQLLLKEESHFDKVVDPAGGSYFIEHITSSLADSAWKLLLEVEEQGGFAKLANEGKIQESVNKSNEERHKAVATRKESLLGTNIFPNFNETASEKLVGEDGRHSGCDCSSEGEITALDFSRGASDFEILRRSTERSRIRPKVFMLTIGNLAMRLARSQFSSNFFACAGYQIIDNLGFKTVKEGVDAAMSAGANIIVLCSSDDEYAEYAPEALKEIDGRVPLVIAGAPASMEELKAQGIEHFIHVKVNVLETLKTFQSIMGISPIQ